MFKSEYFSNSHRVMIANKTFHFIILLLEYFITFSAQVNLYTIKFKINFKENIPNQYFYAVLIQQINDLDEYIKILITSIILVLIFAYFIIYNRFAFENKNVFNIIVINLFENFIFRLFFLIFMNILLAIKNLIIIVMIIISIPAIFLIMKNFFLNHLSFFSPHFIIYPYDYFSSANDLFHIVVKIFISISLQCSIKALSAFLFYCCFILQVMNLIYFVYILNYKSYYIMSNIFLDKIRFSLIAVSVLNNLLLLILSNKHYLLKTYLLISINILLVVILLMLMFYNPYSSAYFLTDDNIGNLFFYYYIIDHLRNDSFLLEEKIRAHFNTCQKCNLCKNLKNYLAKKKCYKLVYKILYNKVSVLGNTMNELIHTVLINGKESLKYNSFYLINLMYCYYININRKNYVLSLNLKLLFETINSENKNILENHSLSTEQIMLINEFLSKADNLLDTMELILTETLIKEKVKNFFLLYEKIFELKSKKFKSKLYYNKNEGIISFYKYISICSMLYEEIFNSSLSNGGMTLKENQIFLDNISNKNNIGINQLIIQLDLLSFENKIIYITGELSKYKGKALCQLFPNIFKAQQLSIMKNKIMNSKFLTLINKDKDFYQNNIYSNTKGKNNSEQFINLQLLIYDEVEHKKIFVIISLKLNLIYPVNIAKKILLTGFYSVNRNIIITLDKSTNENKKEIVLNSEINQNIKSEVGNYSTDEINLIKYKKGDKYYKSKKLLFITKFYVNPNCYNIYSIFHTDKQRTFLMDKKKDDAQKNNNAFDLESKNNIYTGAESTTQNFNFMMMSQTSSTFNQMSNDILNFKKRDKGGKKENKKNNYFRYYQFGLLIFIILIFLFQLIAHIILNNNIILIDGKNSALIKLKTYYGMFSSMFTSTLSITCIAKESKGNLCGNVIENINYQGPPLEIFLFYQNKGSCNPLDKVRQNILEILSNSDDEALNILVNSEMTTLSTSQIPTDKGTKLVAKKQTDSFIDVLNLMTAGFSVLTSDISNIMKKAFPPNINNIVYIINKVDYDENWKINEDLFKYVDFKGQLSDFQTYYYYIILNYCIFIEKLEAISNGLIDKASNTVLTIVSTIKIIIIITLIAYVLFLVSIYFYIQEYYGIIAGIFNEIEKKMDLKNDDISVREMFLQKIEKLKIIISLYKQDIYQAIVDLNFIYDNYKKFVEEKNKEMAKYLKKERFLDEKKDTSDNKSKKIIQNNIFFLKENMIHLYLILISIFIFIVISVIFILLWNSYKFSYQRITYLIMSHGNLANDAYKIMNYYQLMIYNSLTLEDINKIEGFDSSGSEDIFQKIYTDVENLFEAKKYMDNLDEYNLDNIDDYFNHTCESFFENAYKTHDALVNNPNSTNYKGFFLRACNSANIFKSKSYKHIYSMLFEMVQIGMNEIANHSYDSLIAYKNSNHFVHTTTVYLFVYYYTFEILGLKIQRQAYLKISEIFEKYLHLGFIIYYIISIIYLFIILFVYVYKFNKNYRRIHEMKKVFKICNKKE